jgi:hypothetical protein
VAGDVAGYRQHSFNILPTFKIMRQWPTAIMSKKQTTIHMADKLAER